MTKRQSEAVVLILALLTFWVWFGLELYLAWSGLPTISQDVWALYDQWHPLGMIAGLVVGALMAHFFFGRGEG